MSVLKDRLGRAAKPLIAAIMTEGSRGQRPMLGATVLAICGVDDGASEGCISASMRSAKPYIAGWIGLAERMNRTEQLMIAFLVVQTFCEV